jgi:hypothetical protein
VLSIHQQLLVNRDSLGILFQTVFTIGQKCYDISVLLLKRLFCVVDGELLSELCENFKSFSVLPVFVEFYSEIFWVVGQNAVVIRVLLVIFLEEIHRLIPEVGGTIVPINCGRLGSSGVDRVASLIDGVAELKPFLVLAERSTLDHQS